MSENTAENAHPAEISRWKKWYLRITGFFCGSSYSEEDQFPPELPCWRKWVLWFTYGIVFAALLYMADQMLFEILPSRTGGAYTGLGIVLVGLFLDHYFRRNIRAHKARLEDPSEVEALFVHVRNVQPRLIVDDKKRPEDYEEKKEHLDDEMKRLKEELGQKGWTEYQVLPLRQKLVDFLKLDHLIARAQSSLAELDEYAEDSAYRYDIELYIRWQGRVDGAIKKIRDTEDKSPSEQDDAAERLRAELWELLEHVTDYHANWAEGSAVVRSLMICGAAAVPILLVMGLLPILHPGGDGIFGVLNWGLLGISGSLTAVLLYLYKSDRVEVGHTEGKSELWRTVLGATLGFVAGVLIYAIFRAELLSGAAVPDLTYQDRSDLGLTIVWAVGAGMYFEGVFERVRSSMEKGS